MMQLDEFDIETLADNWSVEPSVGDDSRFLTWAEPGWHSWNLASPEVEFCEFVGSAVTMLRPKLVVETGTGQGFVTRRIASRLYGPGRLVTFEQNDLWRAMLATIPFFDGERMCLSDRPTPGAEDFAAAELTVLDSEGPLRLTELRLWAEVAQPGAVVIAHDAGNGHPDFSQHAALARLIGELNIAGLFLRNARGAFIGTRPGRLPVSRTAPPEVFDWYRSA